MTDKYHVDDIQTIHDLGMLSSEAGNELYTCSKMFGALIIHVSTLKSMLRDPTLDSPIEVDKQTLQQVIEKYRQTAGLVLLQLEQVDKAITEIEEIFVDME